MRHGVTVWALLGISAAAIGCAQAEETAACTLNALATSHLKEQFTIDALYSRTGYVGFDCDGTAVQFDNNRTEMQDGEDFLAVSHTFAVGGTELVPLMRLSNGATGNKPTREAEVQMHRGRLSLLARASLNDRSAKVGGWYTDIPFGRVGVDVLATARTDAGGRYGYDVAAGVHSKQLGLWSGYSSLNRHVVIAYAGNNGRAGIYGYSSIDPSTGQGIALVHLGFQGDGRLAGSYDLSWGIPTVRALQGEPPFQGNDLGMFQGGDWTLELGWSRSDHSNYLQAMAGRQLTRWKGGSLSAGLGGRRDVATGASRAIYELRIDQVVGSQGLFLMVRGPGNTATLGLSFSF